MGKLRHLWSRYNVQWLLLALCVSTIGCSPGTYEIDLKMPATRPAQDEQYMCHGVKVQEPAYITDFVPIAQVSRVHHLIVFGCSKNFEPPGEVWECESLVCGFEQPGILYAWARNAPPLEMPPSVGVPIGGNSSIDYLVLQMHYNLQFIGNVVDYSGVTLRVTTNVPLFFAGVYLLAADSTKAIPPKVAEFPLNMSCVYEEDAVIHPFAYRTHAHALGRIITGYQYRENSFALIGKGNPQWPQWFYPAKKNISIGKGDTIVAQCIFDSTSRSTVTTIGAHGLNEMCNFYMYYFVSAKQGSVIAKLKACQEEGDSFIFDKYPADARIPLPRNEVFEKEAAMIHDRFGITFANDWLAGNVKLGQISGITMDNDGNVVVFHRGDRSWTEWSFDDNNKYRQTEEGPIKTAVVAVISSEGRLIKQWGERLFYLPHGIHVDKNNHLWVTDVAMHQVFSFDWTKKDSKPLLALGSAMKPGNDANSFCKPAGVAVAQDGSVFVADGYCNSRVVKFTYDGKFVKSFDLSAQSGTMGHQFGRMEVVHDVTVNNEKREIYAADRENGRIVVFSFNGTLVRVITNEYISGSVYGVTYCPPANVLFVLTGPAASGTKSESRVFVLEAATYRLLYSFRPESNIPFHFTHSIASGGQCNEVFVSLLNPYVLLKATIKAAGPPAPHPTYPPQVETLSISNMNIRAFAENNFYSTLLIGSIGVLAVVGVLLFSWVGCRVMRRRHEESDRSKHPLLKNPSWKKGFQPLMTDDVDGIDYTSDDSEDREDLLYTNKMNKGSDL
uniref:Peptidylglycine monooxygenase n=1 Tax=Trichuris muris TaxID=70415 RepID=A0A5S6QDL4_TRIMR